MNQRTIAAAASLSGVGLHSGAVSRVELRPAQMNSGILFFKNAHRVARVGEETFDGEVPARQSRIGRGDHEILTVEHLLAALSGLGITNIEVDVDGPEIPALDGSSAVFVQLIRDAGIVEQAAPADVWTITEPIFCSDKEKSIAIFPSDRVKVQYVLDYDFPGLRGQMTAFEVTAETFAREIAPARTFCTEAEVGAIRAAGLGRGADASNTIIVDAAGRHAAGLRFVDECARHKILDILGDLQLLGFSVRGRIVGIRSGHSLNRKLVEAIRKQRNDMQQMDIEAIKAVLPHRDPFLFLDRVIERGEKTLVAIKKLTGDEPFFKGHFPGKPVMPGVLMIEALAQAGAVLLLVRPENKGKIVYLASVLKARFRKVVVPGDELRFEVEATKIKSRAGLMRGVAKVAGEEVCEAEIMFSLGV